MRGALIVTASIGPAFALPLAPAALAAPPPQVGPIEDVADRATPGVRIFDDKDGLPQNTISSQAMDGDGRLWVGTQEGIAVYDGVAFHRVLLPEERRSEWITALAAPPDGTIAAGTHGDGVWIWDHGAFTHPSLGLPDDGIRALAWMPIAGGGGELWAGTRKGVARKRGDQWESVAGDPFAGKLVTSITPGAAPGDAWVGGELGVARLAGGAWTTWRRGEAGLPADPVGQILVAGDGSDAWVSFRTGDIARFDGKRWDARKMPCEDALPLAETRAHPGGAPTLWVGTNCGGLVRIDGAHQIVIDKKTSDLPSDFVVTLSPTRPEQGPPALWTGTDGGGLARVRIGGWRALTARNSAIDSPVYAFGWSLADDGTPLTWVGIQSGLLRFDGHAWSTVSLPKIAAGDQYTNDILDARGDAERGLWVATFGGVSRLTNGTWTTYTPATSGLPEPIVLTLFEARRATGELRLLAGMRNGLAQFTGSDWALVDEPGAPTNKDEVTSLAETTAPDGSATLWAATSNAGVFARDHGTWSHYSTTTSPLAGDEVLQVRAVTTPTGQPRLFVSTGEAGLAWLDPNAPRGKWSRLTTKTTPALPDNCVYGVVQDRAGRLYACTNHGVARLAPRADGAYDVQVSRTEDGLPSEECNTGGLAIDPRGRIWAGTLRGAAVLDPNEERDDGASKKLILREARLFEQPINLTQRSALPYDQSTLSFDFALVSYHREAETRYRTQLVGLEAAPSSWTSDAKVRFTSLPAGRYELRVWGRDYAGNESGPLVVPFRIDPAPWRTWWAYVGYVALGAGAIASGVRLREASLKARARELEERIAARTKELAASIRELDQKNRALVESHQRADRIFSALADVLPGSVLDGKYRIEEKIGAGGFGAVFRAEQLALERRVAVKIFRPSAGNDSALALDRFQREGMSACRVNHPNAIQVFDSGISGDGIPYLVMELLEGRSLRSELRRAGPLPLGRALTIAIRVCEALAAAHAAGIIHRDIKPDNVFLQKSKDGEVVKLLDFGIAKLLDGDDALPDATASAALLGTPRYMAPERLARTRNDDARGDVYSVGVTLFETIAGRSPWPKSPDVFQLVTNILTGEPRALASFGVPERVSAIVRSTLAREPEERPTAAKLAEELTEARATLTEAELAATHGTTPEDPSGETIDAAKDSAANSTASVGESTGRTAGIKAQYD
jgi:serine/threonine protein kinase/ligand-binding sensor domain-containing protein